MSESKRTKYRRPIAAALALLALAGCSLTPSQRAETVFQVVNGIDFAQTLNSARGNCFREGNPITRSVIGEHPSEAGVTVYGAAQGAAHYAISAWLDREVDSTDSAAWWRSRLLWHVLTIGWAAHSVIRNERVGAEPFGSGTCP